jgi:hypothetical protein
MLGTGVDSVGNSNERHLAKLQLFEICAEPAKSREMRDMSSV